MEKYETENHTNDGGWIQEYMADWFHENTWTFINKTTEWICLVISKVKFAIKDNKDET